MNADASARHVERAFVSLFASALFRASDLCCGWTEEGVTTWERT